MNTWEVLQIFTSIRDETAVEPKELHKRIFRRTCLKPCLNSTLDSVEQTKDFYKVNSIVTAAVGVEFKEARTKELNGLIKNNTILITTRRKVSDGTLNFGSRFIDEVR